MALTSRSARWNKEIETSPERTKVWTEPPNKHKPDRKFPVVYYLSRNGQLEHPHFIENGFVWHDLAENDFIYPAHGQEYVLKGSELLLLDGTAAAKSDDTVSSSPKLPLPETRRSNGEFDSPVIRRRRNQSWSAIDLHEYKVYKSDSSGESVTRAAADASTQTDDKRRCRRAILEIEEEKEEKCNQSMELSRDEISPPPSDSSPETLESLLKADGKAVIVRPGEVNGDHPSGRTKTSSVLMQLINCGSISFRDCGPGYGKNHPGLSLITQYRSKLPRGAEGRRSRVGSSGASKLVEDKEYFSGSLIETKKDEFPALKRSSSYNADR
ncbi:hypothetical protein RJ639_015657 [Escallonia herrerae]|uniref:SOSEKI DIX-like domain-containing protein n=1 Tax=Escallonia herrerae TaxID=1293975 RepID=A0AA89AK70_9ASTE|nr:hypothetical protein RJ639_015657 [Escallonia herrerae]